MDLLRTIFPYLYSLVPFLLGLGLIFWALVRLFPEKKPVIKKIIFSAAGIALLIFTFAVIRLASVNEIPENELDNSVKKDRQEEMLERSKKAVEESNN